MKAPLDYFVIAVYISFVIFFKKTLKNVERNLGLITLIRDEEN